MPVREQVNAPDVADETFVASAVGAVDPVAAQATLSGLTTNPDYAPVAQALARLGTVGNRITLSIIGPYEGSTLSVAVDGFDVTVTLDSSVPTTVAQLFGALNIDGDVVTLIQTIDVPVGPAKDFHVKAGTFRFSGGRDYLPVWPPRLYINTDTGYSYYSDGKNWYLISTS